MCLRVSELELEEERSRLVCVCFFLHDDCLCPSRACFARARACGCLLARALDLLALMLHAIASY